MLNPPAIHQVTTPAEKTNAADTTDQGQTSSTVLALLAAIGLLVPIYGTTFIELARVWDIDPNYSHGFVVPFACLLIAGWAWSQHGGPLRRHVTGGTVVLGVGILLTGLLLHFIARFIGLLLLDVVSLICVLAGLLRVWGGKRAAKTFGLAAMFLIFMAPLPIAWYQPLAVAMQQLVSSISTEFLTTCGVPTYREGYLIHLPGYTMEVGEACSGLRQMTAILALSVALGYFSNRGPWYRWSLALLSLPIAVGANCLRIMLTGLILLYLGREWADGVFHTLEGLVIVGVAACIMLVTAWLLGKLADRFHRKTSSTSEGDEQVDAEGEAKRLSDATSNRVAGGDIPQRDGNAASTEIDSGSELPAKNELPVEVDVPGDVVATANFNLRVARDT